MTSSMTSLERVLAVLQGKEPDYIPLFPLLNEHAAGLLGMDELEYHRNPTRLAEGQMALVKKFNHDFLLAFTYLAREVTAVGVKTVFQEGMAPVTGKPIVEKASEVANLDLPDFYNHPETSVVLDQIKQLAELSDGQYPIIGVATGPFSLPTLLMGNDHWLMSLFMEENADVKAAMRYTNQFSAEWAKAQLEAGAHGIAIVEGSATKSIIPEDVFVDLVKPSLTQLTAAIGGVKVLVGVGGEWEPFLGHIQETGFGGVILSTNDDLKRSLSKTKDMIMFGNINNLEFMDYTDEDIEQTVKNTLEDGAGGRFVLATQYVLPVGVTHDQIHAFVRYGRQYGKQ